jgi:hypothetical protein
VYQARAFNLLVYYKCACMGTQSFDVSFCDKNVAWSSHSVQFVPGKADAVKCTDIKGGGSANSEEGASNYSKTVDRQRVPFSMECQLCTGVALFVLVSLHILVMYDLAGMIISVYITVLTPLISVFYNVSQQAQVHLYALNLSAVVVIAVSVRYKRDFSFLFLVVLSGVQLHVLVDVLLCKRREDSRALSDPRTCVLICLLVVGNGVAAYFLWQRSRARDYSPPEHGLQALMLVLNACLYIHAHQHASH